MSISDKPRPPSDERVDLSSISDDETLAPDDARVVGTLASDVMLPDRRGPTVELGGHDGTLSPSQARLSSAKTLDSHAADDALASAATLGGEPSVRTPLKAPAGLTLEEVSTRRYEMGDELGRGGMGRILLGVDQRLRRPVAIKELLSGSEAAQQRFEREAFITGQLQHPGIVNVHDAGRWPSGVPFYVMERVHGEELTKRIESLSSLNARLAMLPAILDVADAMAYAHSEGVIHRDLKPDNILIGAFGETIVIDWGLAKRLDEPDSIAPDPSPVADDQGNLTRAGAIMGTPAYMPREQARGEPVDARADVYALGAILYHLLAGAPPWEGTGQGILIQLLSQPSPPLAARVPGVPEALSSLVDKAMSVEADARYPDAGAFAEDLRRFTSGQLVLAHRYGARERLRRWIEQRRAVVFSSAAILLVIIVAVAISFWRIQSINDNLRESNQRLARSLEEVEVQREEAHTQSERAQLERSQAEALVKFLLGDLHNILASINRVDLLSDSFDTIERYYNNIQNDGSRRSLARKRELLMFMGNVRLIEGDFDAARDLYDLALDAANRQLIVEPSAFAARRELAVIKSKFGEIYQYKGQLERADQALIETLKMDRALLEEFPQHAAMLRQDLALDLEQLAQISRTQGDVNAEQMYLVEAVALRQSLRDDAPDDAPAARALALTQNKLAALSMITGELESAEEIYSRVLVIMRALIAEDAENLLWQIELAETLSAFGDALFALARFDDALEVQREAAEISARLLSYDPSSTRWRQALMFSQGNVGVALASLGRDDEALAASRHARDLAAALVEEDATREDWQSALAKNELQICLLLLLRGDVSGAARANQRALGIQHQLVAQRPDFLMWQEDLAMALQLLAVIHRERGEFDAASQRFREATGIRRRHVDADPANATHRVALVNALDDHIKMLLALKKNNDVLPLIEQLIALRTWFFEQAPEVDERLYFLISDHFQAAAILRELADVEAASRHELAVIDLGLVFVERMVSNATFIKKVTEMLDATARVFMARGDFHQASRALEGARVACEVLVERSEESPLAFHALGAVEISLAQAAEGDQRPGYALRMATSAFVIFSRLAASSSQHRTIADHTQQVIIRLGGAAPVEDVEIAVDALYEASSDPGNPSQGVAELFHLNAVALAMMALRMPEKTWAMSVEFVARAPENAIGRCNHVENAVTSAQPFSVTRAAVDACLERADPTWHAGIHALWLTAAVLASKPLELRAAAGALKRSIKDLGPRRYLWSFTGVRATLATFTHPRIETLDALLADIEGTPGREALGGIEARLDALTGDASLWPE